MRSVLLAARVTAGVAHASDAHASAASSFTVRSAAPVRGGLDVSQRSKWRKRYGVSDVAIAKACALLDIPKPPRGYWAKKAAGQKLPDRPALPC